MRTSPTDRSVKFKDALQCGPGKIRTYQASDLSITSSLTNASIHCSSVTLEERPVGMGSVRYMNVLYVVDVCTAIQHQYANQQASTATKRGLTL